MSKVDLNSKEYIEDGYPLREKVKPHDTWKLNWGYRGKGYWQRAAPLRKFAESQTGRLFDEVYSEFLVKMKTNKDFRCVRRLSTGIKSWYLNSLLPNKIEVDSNIWSHNVYITEEGRIIKGSKLVGATTWKKHHPKVLRLQHRKEAIQERKERRRKRAIIRFCENNNTILDDLVRREFKGKVDLEGRYEGWGFGWRTKTYTKKRRVYNKVYVSYDKLKERIDKLNEFYDIPYAFYGEKGKFLTNVTYKRYMK